MFWTILVPLALYCIPGITVSIAARRSGPRGLPSAIVFPAVVLIQQLIFALFATLVSSYVVAVPLAAISVLVLAWLIPGLLRGDRDRVQGKLLGELIPWVLFAATFALFLAARSRYPFLHFYNTPDDVGVEKMFNLSLQQSFLFGQSYPPEWIWLAGEQIRYYAFLKSIPGIWSWIARVVMGDPATGGVYFLLSEAFFISLIPLIVSGWIEYLGRRYAQTRNQLAGVLSLAVVTALFVVVGTHYRALSMGLEALVGRTSGVNWWDLTRLLPGTDNQYIGWLLMLGDNHAYSQVYWVQFLLWGFFVALLVTPRRAVSMSVVLGMIAAAVPMSHPGSVLIDLSSLCLAVAAIIALALAKSQFEFLRVRACNLGVAGLTAVLVVLPLYKPAGSIKFVFPEARLLSQALGFVQLQFSVLVFLGLIAVVFVPFSSYATRFIRRAVRFEWLWVAVVVWATTAYLLDRPALAIMALLSGAVYVYFSDDNDPLSETSLFALVAASSFWIWLVPEIIAFDHTMDNRTDWIRFQLSLRFWPEGFLVIPFSLGLCALPAVSQKKSFTSFMVLGGLVLLIFGASHKPGIDNRAARARQWRSLDGFAALESNFTADARIISFLRTLPAEPQVVIAEACGVGRSDIPVHFSWPGRIAAFSGRVGVCGWARHAMLYHAPLRHPQFTGVTAEQKLSSYEQAYVGLFESVQSGDMQALHMNAAILKGFGVTHVVIGIQERRLFPRISAESIAAALGKTLLFSGGDGTGVLPLT